MKKKKHRTIKELLVGRLLTGIIINEGILSLRCTDARIEVDLGARSWKFGSSPDYWLTFPGLLRIAGVLEDKSQIVLIISGALYSSKIAIRKKTNWRILLDANFV